MSVGKLICLVADESAAQREHLLALAADLARGGGVVRAQGRTLESTTPVARRSQDRDVPAFDPVPRAMVSLWSSGDLDRLADAVRARADGLDPIRVRETVMLERATPDRLTGHVVRVGFMNRDAQLTRDEFASHWVDEHAPMVIDHGPLFDRYVANVVDDPDAAFDGMVEQYFADRDVWDEHDAQVAERKAAVAADADSFTGGFLQMVGRETADVKVGR